jgi:hypothetical protein
MLARCAQVLKDCQAFFFRQAQIKNRQIVFMLPHQALRLFAVLREIHGIAFRTKTPLKKYSQC